MVSGEWQMIGPKATTPESPDSFVKRVGLTAPLLRDSLIGQTTQFARIRGELFLPDGFILEGLDDLRGDSVLLFPRKRSHVAECLFE